MHHRAKTWPDKQRGMSKWGWLLLVGFLIVGSSAALRIGPHYIDFRLVQMTADRLVEKDVHRMRRVKITEHFSKQLRVENFPFKVRDILKIDRDTNQTLIDINYEVREHLFHNIDVVLVFSEQRTYQ